MQKIHPTAIIDPSAKLGDGVKIGAFSIVYGNVEIGQNTELALIARSESELHWGMGRLF